MVKDRLNELRRTHQRNSDENSIQIVENGDPTENSNEFRKTFERAEVVAQWIENIEKNLEIAKELFRKIDNLKYNQKDVDKKVQELFQKNTIIAQQITNKLKEVDAEINKINAESAEGRIKNIQYCTLKTRFQKAFLENNKQLENYKNIQKDIIKAQLVAKGVNEITDEELTSLLGQENGIQIFTENYISETAEAKRILEDVEMRHQQIIKIEQMLTEVRDLFVQMSILVDTQKELVDRVEYQAQMATNYVGAVDLGKVQKSKKKYLMRKLYCSLAIFIVVIILLIILFK